MRRPKQVFDAPNQTELFGVVWSKPEKLFLLRVNDLFRFDGRLCRVVRVTESEAAILMNRPAREFKTRFDKPVRFQPSPAIFHISPNSEIEILNRKSK